MMDHPPSIIHRMNFSQYAHPQRRIEVSWTNINFNSNIPASRENVECLYLPFHFTFLTLLLNGNVRTVFVFITQPRCDENQNPRADDPCFGCRWPERGFQLTVDFELEDVESACHMPNLWRASKSRLSHSAPSCVARGALLHRQARA